MRRRDAGSSGAYVQRFGELDKADTKRVRAPKEHGDLNSDAGGLPLLCNCHRLLVIQELTRHLALV